MSKKSVLQKQFVVYGADSVLGHFVHCISSHFVDVTLFLVVFDCQNKLAPSSKRCEESH